jgi:uncharacterized membrane protein YgcG
MKRLAFTIAALTAGLVALLLAAGKVSASTQDFYFNDFTADYYLSKDDAGVSVLKVQESLTAKFPDFNQNKGVVRVIPRTNQGGKNRVFHDTHVAVTRNGQPEPIYETETDSKNYYISTGTDDYVQGTQKYGFEYKFNRVITEFDDYQELYLDTNGTDWNQRFDALTARVHLGAAKDAFTGDVKCFVGRYGSSSEKDCTYDVSDDKSVVTFKSTKALQAGENLTFAIKFKPGSFVVPPPETSYGVFAVATTLVAVVFGFFIAMLIVYNRKVGIPKKRNQAFIVPEYLPPKSLSLSGATYIYSKAGGSSMAAQLIDLAVKGKVRIIESKSGVSIFKSKKYSIEVIDVGELLPDEEQLLKALAGSLTVGTVVDLTKASESKVQGLAKFAKGIYEHLAAGGFTNQKESRWPSLLLGLVFVVVCASVGFLGAMSSAAVGTVIFMPPMPVTVVTVVLALFALIAASFVALQCRKYINFTDEGYKMRNYLRGLEVCIKLAEADRIKFLQGPETAEKVNVNDKEAIVKLYEKLLPYAMIFGQEKQWAKALELYYDDAHIPGWYSGDTFNAAVFAASVGSFSSSMASTYGGGTGGSSSSGSGFGGGGFSGGGGGGGGGGGR